MKKTVVKTTPFEGQKPGTSGLRKKTSVFVEANYVENFVQATFNALGEKKLKGATLVAGGDGRYYNDVMLQKIIKMSAANGITKLFIGANGLLSTPAVSNLIRNKENGISIGGFILTASHNPGGKDNDCGIKYNVDNGGPAPESVTAAIYQHTTTISEYYICSEVPDVDLSKVGVNKISSNFTVEIVDSTADYISMMKTVFDFTALKKLTDRKDFSMVYDAMHGVGGPYARAIFHDELGLSDASLLNCVPSEDFNSGHPDPNLTYAHDLVHKMGLTSDGSIRSDIQASETIPAFGAAADGDADRNMVLGRKFFVTPSDSLAIIAANANIIPFFKAAKGLKGLARSMPTSGAVDLVAKKLGIPLFEVPTGWKFFGNLMDSADLFNKKDYNPLICGEESFGTGSNHVREKDGIWAVLCWLSILAHFNADHSKPLVTVQAVVEQHWKTYGRNYYCRYDYEGIESALADKVVERLNGMVYLSGFVLKQPAQLKPNYNIAKIDEFTYTDPVDGSVSSHQGWRFVMDDGSRFVIRLSGTGSVGATIRLYIEKFEAGPDRLLMGVPEALGELVALALEVTQIPALTGRDKPSVIT